MKWTVTTLLDALARSGSPPGSVRAGLARELNISVQGVHRAVSLGEMPSGWYWTVLRMVRERGVSIPDVELAVLFSFARLDDAAAQGRPRDDLQAPPARMNRLDRLQYRQERAGAL